MKNTRKTVGREVAKMFNSFKKAGLAVPKGATIDQVSGMAQVMAELSEEPSVATARRASRFVVTKLGVGVAQNLFLALTFLLKSLELDITDDLEKRLKRTRKKHGENPPECDWTDKNGATQP